MKKLLLSLLTVSAVSVIAVFASQAFFSDEERSNGNIFTAGRLDLIVDIDGRDEIPELSGTIFDLPDVKPGDWGQKVISLKVDNNQSCGFASMRITTDIDNSCLEPEGQDELAGPPPGTPGCDSNGELNDQLKFVVWADNCDAIRQGTEGILVTGELTGDKKYAIGELPIKDSNIPNQGAKCYGIGYCFGNISWVDIGAGDFEIACDGESFDNVAQTDSFTADLIFTAEQYRNKYDNVANYPYSCPIGEVN